MAPVHPYETLDAALTMAAATTAPEAFVSGLGASVAIDEIQRVPELLLAIKKSIDEVRRLGRYTAAEFRRIVSDPPVDAAVTMTRLRELLAEAEAFVARIPTEKAGLLFLQGDEVVQPDPGRMEIYETHARQRRGHWPSSPEISAAMLARYGELAS